MSGRLEDSVIFDIDRVKVVPSRVRITGRVAFSEALEVDEEVLQNGDGYEQVKSIIFSRLGKDLTEAGIDDRLLGDVYLRGFMDGTNGSSYYPPTASDIFE